MTINSVSSHNDLYEAMVQQAAALRSAQETRAPAARAAHPSTGQPSSTQAALGKTPEPDTFAHSLSAQTRLSEQRPPPQPTTTHPSTPQFQKKVAGTYRSPWADANSLVVRTRSPSVLIEASSTETTAKATPTTKPSAPKATFVEVHSVYIDAAEEESGRSGRNPLFQFAAQLYQDVVATSRRSTAGEFIGSSFSGVA